VVSIPEHVQDVILLKLELLEIKQSLENVYRYFRDRDEINEIVGVGETKGIEREEIQAEERKQSTIITKTKDKEEKDEGKQKEKLPTVAALPEFPASNVSRTKSQKSMLDFKRNRDTHVPGDTSECMAQPFMLLSKQRSGFHFFRSLLDQHPKSR